jgi:hypothetical protein
MDTSTAFEDLRAFRRSLHRCFDRRADALFELGDAMLTAALDRGRIDVEALRELLARPPLADERPPIYAVDVSVWARCDAETSPERGFYYHPSRHSTGQPIVAGWAYQWIAQIGFVRESWVAPVFARARQAPAAPSALRKWRLVNPFSIAKPYHHLRPPRAPFDAPNRSIPMSSSGNFEGL